VGGHFTVPDKTFGVLPEGRCIISLLVNSTSGSKSASFPHSTVSKLMWTVLNFAMSFSSLKMPFPGMVSYQSIFCCLHLQRLTKAYNQYQVLLFLQPDTCCYLASLIFFTKKIKLIVFCHYWRFGLMLYSVVTIKVGSRIDTFSALQHKFGPYQPIIDYHKAHNLPVIL